MQIRQVFNLMFVRWRFQQLKWSRAERISTNQRGSSISLKTHCSQVSREEVKPLLPNESRFKVEQAFWLSNQELIYTDEKFVKKFNKQSFWIDRIIKTSLGNFPHLAFSMSKIQKLDILQKSNTNIETYRRLLLQKMVDTLLSNWIVNKLMQG